MVLCRYHRTGCTNSEALSEDHLMHRFCIKVTNIVLRNFQRVQSTKKLKRHCTCLLALVFSTSLSCATGSRVPGLRRSFSLPTGLCKEKPQIISLQEAHHYIPAHSLNPESQVSKIVSEVPKRPTASWSGEALSSNNQPPFTQTAVYARIQTELYPHLRF